MSADLRAPLVFDASVTINFLGSGIPGQLMRLLDQPVLMAERAFQEIQRHPIGGKDHAEELRALIDAGRLTVRALDRHARELFFDLTSGDLSEGLDDGEAATIALAISRTDGAIAVLDDRKARNLMASRWPDQNPFYTVNLLMCDAVAGQLSRTELADATYSALRHARMRVPVNMRKSIVELIGADKACQCTSLGVL